MIIFLITHHALVLRFFFNRDLLFQAIQRVIALVIFWIRVDCEDLGSFSPFFLFHF